METWFANLFFTLIVLLTVVPAIMVVLTLNIVRSACWLLLSLTGTAGLFFFLGADFVGATQILIYVGGTMVLVIFGVMLTATGPFINLASRGGDWVLGLLAGAAVLGLLTFGLTADVWQHSTVPTLSPDKQIAQATTNEIGLALLGIPVTTPIPERSASAAPASGHGGGGHGPAEHSGNEKAAEHAHGGNGDIPANAHAGDEHGHDHSHADAHSPGASKAGHGKVHRSSSYLFPFEIVSVHLVIVLIGAAYLARAKRKRTPMEEI